MKCSNCGAEISDDSRFCTFCGAKTIPVGAKAGETPAETQPVQEAPEKKPVKSDYFTETTPEVALDEYDYEEYIDPHVLSMRIFTFRTGSVYNRVLALYCKAMLCQNVRSNLVHERTIQMKDGTALGTL